MKSRVSKLGQLLSKMLDNEDGWEIYTSGSDTYLRHKASNWYLYMTTPATKQFDFANHECLTPADIAHNEPKARAILAKMTKQNEDERYRASMKKKQTTRRAIYQHIIHRVMGI